jgi:hypothetical protein
MKMLMNSDSGETEEDVGEAQTRRGNTEQENCKGTVEALCA